MSQLYIKAMGDPQEKVSCTPIAQAENRGPQKAWHLPKVTPSFRGEGVTQIQVSVLPLSYDLLF